MRRTLGRLTELKVRRANEPGLYADGGGLYLQVATNGSRSWIFRYGPQGRRYHGLGPLHTVGLADARKRAQACRQLLIDGNDPIAVKRDRIAAAKLEAAKTKTFSSCAAEYIQAHGSAWKNPQHRQQWASTLARFADPVFGHLPIAAVDTGLVMRVLEPIWTAKPETASRLRMRIERILAWAQVRGYRNAPNPARWRGHLDHLLPKLSKVARVQHRLSVSSYKWTGKLNHPSHHSTTPQNPARQ